MLEDDFHGKHPAPLGAETPPIDTESPGHGASQGSPGAVGGAPATSEPHSAPSDETDEILAHAHVLLATGQLAGLVKLLGKHRRLDVAIRLLEHYVFTSAPESRGERGEFEAATDLLVEYGNLVAAARLLAKHGQRDRAIVLLLAQGHPEDAAELLAEQGELTQGVNLLVAQGLIREACGLVFRKRYVQQFKEARRKLSGSDSLSKEVCQNAFLELYRAFINEASKGKPIRNIDALLRRLLIIAINKAWGKQRTSPAGGASSTSKGLEDLEDGRTVGQYDASNTRHDVRRLLEILEPQDRMIFWCRYFDDLSWDEIGSITGMPASTARSRYSRAKAKLKEHWRKR